MTQKAGCIKAWMGRARLLYEQLQPLEQAAEQLEDGCAYELMDNKRLQLRKLEYRARMESYDLLVSAKLTPREFTILQLHYIEYQSWNTIAERLNIGRRYALQVHVAALERLAEQADTLIGRALHKEVMAG